MSVHNYAPTLLGGQMLLYTVFPTARGTCKIPFRFAFTIAIMLGISLTMYTAFG